MNSVAIAAPGPPPAPFPLLAISDRRGLAPGLSLLRWVQAMGEAGVAAVQLREKDLADRAVVALGVECRRLLPAGAALLVNGRADLARAAGADGVHLSASEVSPAVVRRWLGAGFLVGRSTHRVEEVEEAAAAGADYVTFGPVWATPSKSGPTQGTDGLEAACQVGIPVVALGGVSVDRLAAAAAAGARGAAGIRLFRDPLDLAALVRAAREAFPG